MTTLHVEKDIELKNTTFKDGGDLLLTLIHLYKHNEDVVSLGNALSDLEQSEEETYQNYTFKTVSL